MFRRVLRDVNERIFRYFNRRGTHDSKKDQASIGDVAYETEYYYKQDKKLLKAVKQKTQDEVKNMRDEIQAMRNKIEEHNRNINENLRFLRGLEQDLSANGTKKN